MNLTKRDVLSTCSVIWCGVAQSADRASWLHAQAKFQGIALLFVQVDDRHESLHAMVSALADAARHRSNNMPLPADCRAALGQIGVAAA